MFFQEFLHVCIVKFFSHIGLQIFRASSIVSNYLCYRCNHLISILCFERYGPCILTQYIDNGKNVMVTFIESCVRAHFDHISLLQVIVSVNYDVCVDNFFSLERAVLLSVTTFQNFSSQIFFVVIYNAKNVTKILRKRC